jgi:hypothetical protein
MSIEVLIENVEKECQSLQSKLDYLETGNQELNRSIEKRTMLKNARI